MFHPRRLACASTSLAIVVLFATPPNARAAEVFGTKRGKVYHTHGAECASARKIMGDNRVTFATEEEAKTSGRRLCKRCEALDRQQADRAEPKQKKADPPPGDDGRKAEENREGDAPPQPAVPPDTAGLLVEFATVTKVLPGGTLVLDNGEHARLLGITCPARGQPREKDATRFIAEETRGRTVRFACESASCRAARRDELGRLLIYASAEPDGRDLGGELVFQGYAWVDRDVPFARQSEYRRFEEEAWRAGRGIWERGDKYEPGGETVVTGRHAHCYHPPNCQHAKLMAGVMTLTLNDAKARRLVPCSEYKGKR